MNGIDSMNCFSCICRGESHLAEGKPCQDFSLSEKLESGTVITIISDGHGGKAYFRSDKGARFACEVALQSVKTFLDSVDASLFENIGQIGVGTLASDSHPGKMSGIETVLRHLAGSIISQWRKKVSEDAGDTVLSECEKANVEQKYIDLLTNTSKLYRVYGCTLLAYVATPTYWFAFHIGDGKCLAFYDKENGKKMWDEPIPWDEKCFLNKTTSLCEDNASEDFRFAAGGMADIPVAVFLGSDGIDDSFSSDEALANFYIKILKEIVLSSHDKTIEDIKASLPILSRQGSQDDMSVACAYDMERLKSNIIAYSECQMQDIVKDIDKSEKRVSSLTERLSKLDEYLETKKQWIFFNGKKKKLEQQLGLMPDTDVQIEQRMADKGIQRENEKIAVLKRRKDILSKEMNSLQEVIEKSEISLLDDVKPENDQIMKGSAEPACADGVNDVNDQTQSQSKEQDVNEMISPDGETKTEDGQIGDADANPIRSE